MEFSPLFRNAVPPTVLKLPAFIQCPLIFEALRLLKDALKRPKNVKERTKTLKNGHIPNGRLERRGGGRGQRSIERWRSWYKNVIFTGL